MVAFTNSWFQWGIIQYHFVIIINSKIRNTHWRILGLQHIEVNLVLSSFLMAQSYKDLKLNDLEDKDEYKNEADTIYDSGAGEIVSLSVS